MNVESTWTDHLGVTRPTPTILGRLKFRIPLHAALRAFVHHRDGFACCICGVVAPDVPANYDGRNAAGRGYGPRLLLVADHIVSRRNGGSHHPSNLQTLCESCNARKSGLVDSKHRSMA